MGAPKKYVPKKRSPLQQLAQLKGAEASRTIKTPSTKHNAKKKRKALENTIKASATRNKENYDTLLQDYKNLERRNIRLQASKVKKNDLCKDQQKKLLQGEKAKKNLQKKVDELGGQVLRLDTEIWRLKGENFGEKKRKERTQLRKANTKLRHQLKIYKEQLIRSKPRKYHLFRKGVYTREARALARYMVSKGMAERHVGSAIKDIGKVMGVEIDRIMDQRTVQRSQNEVGVAADIQLAYEVVNCKKLTFSSDSTSHKHIEYESRAIALEVVDYHDPSAEPRWVTRSLGLDTSIDHCSETQVKGLRRRLHELANIFNDSPLAERENVQFKPDDFAFKLFGTSGDHAADQKKSHTILEKWRMDVVLQRMGEEALTKMAGERVVVLLASLKMKQIEDLGGMVVWEGLDDDTKMKKDTEILQELGKEVLKTLPQDEQNKLTMFIRTGCCMHKDLNCVKAGDRAMQALYLDSSNPIPRPTLLANRDNAHVISDIDTEKPLTEAQSRALNVSKCGASHAVTLGGMICRNKDKKKGLQDTYRDWMEKNVGTCIPYPDVSNTRYGTHGAAAAVVLVYRELFIAFMKEVHNTKIQPGFTNIEANFNTSLTDMPTIAEFCVLALYHHAVSRPFMEKVRLVDNILLLETFFNDKATFLERIAAQPSLWISPGQKMEDTLLGGGKWSDETHAVFEAVHALQPSLPHLSTLVTAFVTGAREAFINRFSDEFQANSAIRNLSQEDRAGLFISSTNDFNEGALGSFRLAQRLRAAETLQKFNSSFKSQRNHTEDFIQAKLQTTEDDKYLRKVARSLDASGQTKKRKLEQIEANKTRAEDNRVRVAKRVERENDRVSKIAQTAAHLILEEDGVTTGLKVETLDSQLDYHREAEKTDSKWMSRPIPGNPCVPLKSHIRQKPLKMYHLKLAIARFHLRDLTRDDLIDLTKSNSQHIVSPASMEEAYESDYNDDCI